MTSPHLDTRVIRMLRWLLDQSRPRSTASLASALGLTQRVVRYRLGAVDAFLASNGLTLERQRGSGLWIEADPDVKAALLAELSDPGADAPRVYAPLERDHVLLAAMLWAAPEPTSIERLHDELEVSRASARRDLKRNEAWLEQRGLVLLRRPGIGVSVVGPETRIRQALVHLTIESTPEDVLDELRRRPFAEAKSVRVRVPAGVREHLGRLRVQATTELIADSTPPGTLSSDANELVLALYLSVTAARLEDGHTITMETGLQRSLSDHPVAEAAATLAARFEQTFGLELPALEVAGITEYLLGLAALDLGSRSEDADSALVDHILVVAAERLHDALADDAELRRSLSQHLDRLAVRLRYGLPIHNPLLGEVRERYPDVHALATELGQAMSERFGEPIVEDEIGYITMYLCGALERTRLRPARRAVVVCPSGMATVWVLVSRIQTEFPQLELVQVLSHRDYEALGDLDADLVITTVDIPQHAIPVVVVNPLLPPADVKRVAELA